MRRTRRTSSLVETVDDPTTLTHEAVTTGLLSALSHHLGRRVDFADDLVLVDGAFGPGTFSGMISVAGHGHLDDAWTGPLVMRVAESAVPDDTQAIAREAAILAFATANGLPTPRPVTAATHTDNELGRAWLVATRPPGRSMIELIAENPLNAPAQLAVLADLQATLHALPAATNPGFTDLGFDLVDRAFVELQRLFALVESTAYAREQAWLLANLPATADPVLCHANLQPAHVVVDEGTATSTITNWARAGLADRELDVAMTLTVFWSAPLFARTLTERVALRVSRDWVSDLYLGAYEEAARLDGERLAYWRAFHACHQSARVAAFHQAVKRGETPREDPALYPQEAAPAMREHFWDLVGQHRRA